MLIVATNDRGLESRKGIGNLKCIMKKELLIDYFSGITLVPRLLLAISRIDIFERLDGIEEDRPDLMTFVKDIREDFGVYRSFPSSVGALVCLTCHINYNTYHN